MANKQKIELFRLFIEWMAKNVDDATALEHPEAFPKWKAGELYEKDDRCRYEEVLYKVLQNHTSSAEWTPDIAVSLYVKVSEEEFPEWEQPQGSHDAYMTGDKVTHLEKHWISTMDYNTYEPGVYGWEEIE